MDIYDWIGVVVRLTMVVVLGVIVYITITSGAFG